MAGWSFDFSRAQWQPAQSNGPVVLEGPLRLATLNVLFDTPGTEAVLLHEARFEAICAELCSIDAHIIGLNEVTLRFVQKLLSQQWVRETYFVSAVPAIADPQCKDLAAVRAPPSFGNLLLSRIPLVSLEYIPLRRREVHLATVHVSRGASLPPLRLAVASAHLMAFPFFKERQRSKELRTVAEQLQKKSSFDASVLMGDFNFHREAENASIPAGWQEVPAVVRLGHTWSYTENTLIPRMLPFWLPGMLGWPKSMRLDRMLIHGGEFDCNAATARLFANRPIRSTTVPDYLFPSDHYGALVQIPLVAAPRIPPATAAARQHAAGWYCWVCGGRVGVRGFVGILASSLLLGSLASSLLLRVFPA